MAIFGIKFSDFGSRKLRIDSQNNNINFKGDAVDTAKKALVENPMYAPPEQMNNENQNKENNTPKKENYTAYVNMNTITPIKEEKLPPKEPPVAKYALPEE